MKFKSPTLLVVLMQPHCRRTVEAQSGVIEAQSAVIEAQYGLIEAQSGVIEAQSGVIEAQSAVIEAKCAVIGLHGGFLRFSLEPCRLTLGA